MANTPTYLLYHGKATGKDKQGKKIWTRIGEVWPFDKHEQDTHLVPDEFSV